MEVVVTSGLTVWSNTIEGKGPQITEKRLADNEITDNEVVPTFPKNVAFFSFIGDVGAEIVFEGGAGA